MNNYSRRNFLGKLITFPAGLWLTNYLAFPGLMKIADYASITRTPVATHNAGTLIRTYVSAHFSMAIDNFYKSESRLGRPERMYEQMATKTILLR
jgi:hypothetical protein